MSQVAPFRNGAIALMAACGKDAGIRGIPPNSAARPNLRPRDFMTNRIHVIDADITTLGVDAVVNAANTSLLGGGGVDGAIHRTAGAELLAECRTLGGCRTGEAKLTKGYRLPARYVIHTAGPVWNGGRRHEQALLASCYRRSLEIAAAEKFKTVAFLAISTGVYGFPLDRAARIAVAEVRSFLASHELPETVSLVCFGQPALDAFQAALRTAMP